MPSQDQRTRIYFPGTQTLNGTGTVNLATVYAAIHATDAGTLTIGSDMLVSGAGQVGSTTGLVNLGTIRADIPGLTMTVTGQGWTNQNVIEAVNGGRVQGSGTLTNSGTVGISASSLFTLSDDYIQDAAGTLTTELGGTSSSLYGRLEVSGTATLDGTLIVTTDGFEPMLANAFDVVTGTISGSFSSQKLPPLGAGLVWSVLYPPDAPNAVRLVVDPR